MLIGPTSGATRLRRLGRERTRAVLGGADGSVSPRFCRHANRRELLVPLLACAIYLAHGLQWSYFPPFLPEVLLFLAVKHLRQLSIGPLAVAFGVLRAVGASSLLVQGQVTFVTSCIPVFMLHVLMAEKHFPLVMELSVLLLLLSSNVMEPLLSIAWHQPASIIGSSLAGLLVGAVSRYYVIATLEMQERLVANEATIKYLRGKVFEQCIDVMALLENTSRPQSPTATYMDPLEPHAAYISRALQNVTKAYDWGTQADALCLLELGLYKTSCIELSLAEELRAAFGPGADEDCVERVVADRTILQLVLGSVARSAADSSSTERLVQVRAKFATGMNATMLYLSMTYLELSTADVLHNPKACRDAREQTSTEGMGLSLATTAFVAEAVGGEAWLSQHRDWVTVHVMIPGSHAVRQGGKSCSSPSKLPGISPTLSRVANRSIAPNAVSATASTEGRWSVDLRLGGASSRAPPW